MRKLLTTLAIAASFTLGGCATSSFFAGTGVGKDISNIVGVISGATVTPRDVIVASNSVDALQDTATAYLRLPLCRPGGTPVCRVCGVKVRSTCSVTQSIKRAVFATRSARNGLGAFLAAHPGTAPPASLYEKVTAAVSLLGGVIAQYRVNTVVSAMGR